MYDDARVLFYHRPKVLLIMFQNENAYDDLIYEACQFHDVPPVLVKAVIATESGFNPRAYRAEPQIGDASRGLMQMLKRTAIDMGFPANGNPDDLYKPEVSIPLGVKYLRWILDRHPNDSPGDVYAVYNSGNHVKGIDGVNYKSAQVRGNVANFQKRYDYFYSLAYGGEGLEDGNPEVLGSSVPEVSIATAGLFLLGFVLWKMFR